MKQVLITGGATGIGAATAQVFLERGYRVFVTVHQTAAELPGVTAIPCDITDPADVERLFAAVGTVDVLVNNAGIWLSGYVTEISPQDWDLVMNVNLKAIFHLSQLFVNHCLQHDQMGSILNITSQAAFHGSTTGHAHYAASKAGLVAFAISLARLPQECRFSLDFSGS